MGIEEGGGTTRTSWAGTPMPTMWAALKDYDSAPHWQMAGAWRQSYELLITHISQVKQYRDNLVAAWPPHKSKAAAAYVLELDGLIENLEETYEASISNYQALSTATSAITEARRELEVIKNEYESNQTLLAEYEEDLNSRPTRYTPPTSPVADGRQTQLQLQAASIMQSLSAELATAQTSFIAPRPYTAVGRINDSGESLPNSGGVSGPAFTPGFSPRSITPVGNSKSVSSPGRGKATIPTGGGKEKPTPSKQPPSQGPILGGTKPIPNPNPTGPGAFPTTPANTPANIPPNINSPGGPYTFSPSTSTNPSNNIPRHPSANGTPVGGLPPSGGSGTRGTTLPNNGIIGGNPAVGGGMPGRPGQTSASMRGGQKVNPTGGMIGSQGPGGTGVQPGPRQRPRSEENPHNRRWDPDNPWETTGGVDPVLLPSPEQRIDPGPTIGGR